MREGEGGIGTFVWVDLEAELYVPSGGSPQGSRHRKSHGVRVFASDDEGSASSA